MTPNNAYPDVDLGGLGTQAEIASEHTTASPSLFIADVVGIAILAVTLLVAGYLRSRHRMFWGDEIMGRLTLGQPTWSGLLRYWRSGLDSSGIFYYVLARPWASVFGLGELSLRTFSALGMVASAALVWITARRYYSLLPVAASIAIIYTSSSALRWQLSNARGYGVFMTASALVLYLLFRGEEKSVRRRPTPLFLLATLAAYSLLAGSHILGALYVSAFLGTQLLFDLKSRRFRPTLYLAAAASFVVVLFSRANLLATSAMGKPSFWTIRPRIYSFLHLRAVTDYRIRLVIVALVLLAFFSLRIRFQRTPIYLLFTGFLALDLLVFEISRHATSIYVDRYLMPFAFITILLMCELLTQLREADLRFPQLRSALPVFLVLLACWNISHPDRREPWLPYRNYTAELLQSIPPGLTVVVPYAGPFLEMRFYHPDGFGHTLLYPIDWPIALDPSNSGGVSGVHELENFKALGIYADSILPTEQVLSQLISQKRDFIVLSRSVWFDRRITADPRFVVSHLSLYQGDMNNFDVWQVHTR